MCSSIDSIGGSISVRQCLSDVLLAPGQHHLPLTPRLHVRFALQHGTWPVYDIAAPSTLGPTSSAPPTLIGATPGAELAGAGRVPSFDAEFSLRDACAMSVCLRSTPGTTDGRMMSMSMSMHIHDSAFALPMIFSSVAPDSPLLLPFSSRSPNFFRVACVAFSTLLLLPQRLRHRLQHHRHLPRRLLLPQVLLFV